MRGGCEKTSSFHERPCSQTRSTCVNSSSCAMENGEGEAKVAGHMPDVQPSNCCYPPYVASGCCSVQLHTPVIFYFEEGHQDGEIHAPPSTSPGKVPRKAPPRLFLWKLQQEPSRQPTGHQLKHPNMGREKEDKHTTVRVRVCACACSCSEADSRPSRVEACLAYFDQRWIIQHDLPGGVSLVRALAFMGKRERTRRYPAVYTPRFDATLSECHRGCVPLRVAVPPRKHIHQPRCRVAHAPRDCGEHRACVFL